MTPSSPPDSILLISDLHLEPARPELTQAFGGFLATTATTARALYILGDLFNVWLGDDDDTPLFLDISQQLKMLSERGTDIFLMHGNRDFLLGPRYAAACGATLLDEPQVLTHQGTQYLLMHGDVLCTRDADYSEFRKMVRSPEWQADFLAKPLSMRRAFAEQARTHSKTMNSNKPADIMDVTQDEVERLLQKYEVDTLIHGHTHRPAEHQFSCAGKLCKRYVLGDWDKRGWYLRLTAGAPDLQSFVIAG